MNRGANRENYCTIVSMMPIVFEAIAWYLRDNKKRVMMRYSLLKQVSSTVRIARSFPSSSATGPQSSVESVLPVLQKQREERHPHESKVVMPGKSGPALLSLTFASSLFSQLSQIWMDSTHCLVASFTLLKNMRNRGESAWAASRAALISNGVITWSEHCSDATTHHAVRATFRFFLLAAFSFAGGSADTTLRCFSPEVVLETFLGRFLTGA